MVKRYQIFLFLIACLFVLSACGSSAVVKKAVNESPNGNYAKYSIDGIKSDVEDVPEHFLTAVKRYLKEELDKQDLLATAGTSTTYEINIIVRDYRMRSEMSRVMLGALAGKDGVESTVTITNPITGEVAGESTVSTFNVTAVAGMDEVAKMHAEKIAVFVSGDIN